MSPSNFFSFEGSLGLYILKFNFLSSKNIFKKDLENE